MKKSLFCILVLTPAVICCMEESSKRGCRRYHKPSAQVTGEQAQFFRLNESEQRNINLAVSNAKRLAACTRTISRHGWYAALGAGVPTFMLSTLIGTGCSNAPMVKVFSVAVIIGGIASALGKLGAWLWHREELDDKRSDARQYAGTWARADIGGPCETTVDGCRYGLIEAIRKFPQARAQLHNNLRNPDRHLLNAFQYIVDEMEASKAKQEEREQRAQLRADRAAEQGAV